MKSKHNDKSRTYYFSLKNINPCTTIKHKRRQNPGLSGILAKRHAGRNVSFLIL